MAQSWNAAKRPLKRPRRSWGSSPPVPVDPPLTPEAEPPLSDSKDEAEALHRFLADAAESPLSKLKDEVEAQYHQFVADAVAAREDEHKTRVDKNRNAAAADILERLQTVHSRQQQAARTAVLARLGDFKSIVRDCARKHGHLLGSGLLVFPVLARARPRVPRWTVEADLDPARSGEPFKTSAQTLNAGARQCALQKIRLRRIAASVPVETTVSYIYTL